jgi:molybdate transport system substrate-binding protein
MASVDTVPAGKYGKAALTYLGVWGRGRAPRGSGGECSCCACLRGQGRAPTRHRLWDGCQVGTWVKVVGTFPEASHPKILYPVALTAPAKPEARKLLEFLLSSEAAPSFEAQGFSIEGKDA